MVDDTAVASTTIPQHATATATIEEAITETASAATLDDDDELILEDSDSYDSDDDEFVDQCLESQWQDGVETALTVKWPTLPLHKSLHLSTQLPESAMAPLFDGTGWAGTRVWKAALLAVQYMEQEYLPKQQQQQQPQRQTQIRRPLSLLELGCGLGVPGMLWHRLQQTSTTSPQAQQSPLADNQHHSRYYRVVLTDRPSLVSQLQANLQANFPNDDDDDHHSISAQALSWSPEGLRTLLQELQQQQQRKGDAESTAEDDDVTSSQSSSAPFQFDFCLNCDCIYEPLYGRDSWMALADVLSTLAELSPQTLLITSVERRNGDGLQDFWERLHQSPHVGKTERVVRNDDDKHHVIEIYVTKSAQYQDEKDMGLK
jgi:Lysine methyltransferase